MENESCNLVPDPQNTTQRTRKRSRIRFSMRAALIFMTLAAVLVGNWARNAKREIRGRTVFTSPEVDGTINELKPTWIAGFIPKFARAWIGEDYFQVATSVSAHAYLNTNESQKYHPEQSLELLAESLGQLRHLKYADLIFHGSPPHSPIDLTSLSKCTAINQLELTSANSKIISNVAASTNAKCLCLDHCTVDDSMINSLLKNETITSLHFAFASVSGDQLKRFSDMKKLQQIHFFQCKPTISKDGMTLDLNAKEMNGSFDGGFVRINSNEAALIRTWFERELPGVTASGLGTF